MLLELGGKDPAIVAEDADLDEAAAHIVWGALQNAGQGCISLEVAYVVDSVHDAFVGKVTELAQPVRAGNDDNAQMGPIPLAPQIPVIRHHIEDALARGASAPVGGPETATGDRYVQPTVLVGVPVDALAVTEETFGPPLAIVKVALPFGGRGDSGYGRKHGVEGLREFAYPHAITEKTGPAPFPTSTFDRPAGSMAAALASRSAARFALCRVTAPERRRSVQFQPVVSSRAPGSCPGSPGRGCRRWWRS